jgi:hypothetical protein
VLPQTTVLPHTTVLPQTTVAAFVSLMAVPPDDTLHDAWQSAPPHVDPQTTFCVVGAPHSIDVQVESWHAVFHRNQWSFLRITPHSTF